MPLMSPDHPGFFEVLASRRAYTSLLYLDHGLEKSFLSYALRLIRENFILNFNGRENRIVYLTRAEDEFSEKFHPFINEKNINALNSEFNLAYAHVESNGNTKMIFLDLALKTMRLIR